VPVLAKGPTETGRVWVYVRDDRPFGGKDPSAALFYASAVERESILSGMSAACLHSALSREPNLARAKIGSPNSGSGCGSSSPRLESFFSEDAERAAGCEMALDVESVLDDGVNGQEALS
jgi:hypothetical protein